MMIDGAKITCGADPTSGELVAARRDQVAPRGCRRGYADTEDAQSAFENDHDGDGEQRDGEHRGQHIGQDVADDDATVFAPMLRAANTNSRCDHASVDARVMRPMIGIDTSPNRDHEPELALAHRDGGSLANTATSARASTSCGIARNTLNK